MARRLILDTNVLSEMWQPMPAPQVAEWYLGQDSHSLYTTTVTMAEVFYGIYLLPTGRKRERLVEFARDAFFSQLQGRILPFDEEAARHYAVIRRQRRRKGPSIAPLDAQIAAIADQQGALVVSRNASHFEVCGVDVFNPWETEVPPNGGQSTPTR